MFVYFLVCFLQPIMLPIPEPVTIIAGSTVFGPYMGAFLGFLGTILGIITMFFLGRMASEKIISKFIDESSLEKFNRYIEKNEIIMLFGLFILPILPDEIICIGAGLARIKKIKFIVVAIVSKLITSISLAFSISLFNISLTNIVAIMVVMAIIWVLVTWLYKMLRGKASKKTVCLFK